MTYNNSLDLVNKLYNLYVVILYTDREKPEHLIAGYYRYLQSKLQLIIAEIIVVQMDSLFRC